MLSAKLKEAAGNSADATLYVDDVFSTWLYTGNGSTQTITNGIDLAGKGGMVWVKSRSAATDHKLTDTVRGATKALISNTTGAETTDSTGLTAFSSTGFSLGANSDYNTNAATYASWTFREAAKFFDVVTYTGTGSARTIAHSLGSAPGMIIVKRTDTTSNWQVYSNGLTSAAYSIQLNLSNAQASAPTVWNSTAPTSSVFSVGTDATVNASGGTYVAYLFAHDAGGFGLTGTDNVISCGSFTRTFGTANSVNIGYEPQWVLIKCTSQTDSWQLYDTMRGLSQTASLKLEPNSANPESDTVGMKPTATGFDITATGIGGGTFIYMAIRMPNKPPTLGTQVFYPNARTGTGGIATISGIGFTPDLYTVRSRSLSNDSYFADRLRGTSVSLVSQYTFSEADVATSVVNSFDMTGATIPNAGAMNNQAAATYIDYFFKRAPGFFDEVCYTGAGTAGQTNTHNLGVVPELMIVKQRDNTGNWAVYTAATAATNVMYLNTTNASFGSSGFWNNTAPTASVFTIGSNGNVNNATSTYVAYLFATLAGISKVGSYTGNGTGQAIACGFSGGARFVLIKRTDASGSWYTFDSARGLTSGSSPYLLLNSTAAEVTGNNGVYASSGGFTLGATASTTTNISGASYIFLSVS